ncbi:MAG TPA: DUF2330 domain-containing protein [Candidatus Acidoferrum sp.]|nr:DUF2330 domain-containing protein [Candidatus Acidoferrum sp.]
MKSLTLVLLVSLLVGFLVPADLRGDGGFVVSKFVWDKYKDINEPTQKAILVYDNGQEDLILQVKYEGPADEFGWLIPVPNLPTVEKGSMECFYELSRFTQQHFEEGQFITGAASLGTKGYDAKPEPPVKVIETKTVGAYETAVLSTRDAGALEKWLETNHFYFPTNKTGVLDAYVQQHWYFIAVKINLGKSLSGLSATAKRLASGELHPLQISFASDGCVYPLKISSINGQPSEVQVYVLSPEPLLERTMLEMKLPLIYSNDVVRARAKAQEFERYVKGQRDHNRRFMGATTSDDSPLPPDQAKPIQEMTTELYPAPDELLPYVKVTKTNLPDCARHIPRLGERSWWLSKQTWTFRPEEMDDLEFGPALPVFVEMLGSKFGYFADASLASFGSDGVPTILAAMQSTNPIVRANAAVIFWGKSGSYWSYAPEGFDGNMKNPAFVMAATNWLNDSEPKVRKAGIAVLTHRGNWDPKFAEPLIALLRDKDAEVRQAVAVTLGPAFRNDLKPFIPTFEQMLKDESPDVRSAALLMLQHQQVAIPRAELLPFFKSSDWRILDAAYDLLRNQEEKLTVEDAAMLLENPAPVAQLLGLGILNQNPGKESVALALPLLRAPDEFVRLKAAQTLRALTGQHFTEDQIDEWMEWWMKNKTNFVIHLHPEELRPQLR